MRKSAARPHRARTRSDRRISIAERLDEWDLRSNVLKWRAMARMSNRDRIARAAAEARAAADEKAAKKTAKATAPAKPRAKKTAQPVRMKVVWDVVGSSGAAVKTFPYAEKPAAEADAIARTRSTGRTHVVRASKVPME